MIDKNIFGLFSIAVTVAVTVPYLHKMLRGIIKPHIFTWAIWSLTTGIAAAARGAAHAGPGAWAQWASALSCLLAVIFAFRKSDHNIARSDIVAFGGALCAIPAWMMTHNPLAAVVIVTFIDMLGYYPTFRKSYTAPHHEAVFNYVMANIIHVFALCATLEYSLTNVLFPVALFVANTALIIFVLLRRKVVPAPRVPTL